MSLISLLFVRSNVTISSLLGAVLHCFFSLTLYMIQPIHFPRSKCITVRTCSVCVVSPNKLCGRPPQYAPAPCKLLVSGRPRLAAAGCPPTGCSRLRPDVCNKQTSDRQTSDTCHC